MTDRKPIPDATAGDAAIARSLAQRQLEAYNARDLEAFLANFSDDVEAFRPPQAEPALAGKAAFGKFYATQRFNLPGLHAEILDRVVMGRIVIDHERITGVRDEPFEMAVVFEVAGGLIRRTWAFAP
jgi:hypothetical protein